MRLIGTLYNVKDAEIFSLFLKRKGINHQIDAHKNSDWGSSNYGITESRIWVEDEDQAADAVKWFKLFQENSQDCLFNSSGPITPVTVTQDFAKMDKPDLEKPTRWDKQPMGLITRMILLTCTLLLIASELLTSKISSTQADNSLLSIYSSPIDKTLLYDFPLKYELIDRFIQLYGKEESKNIGQMPPEEQVLLDKIKKTPVWEGFYSLLTDKSDLPFEVKLQEAPLFEKIRQGQIWRLFTPALLHADIFHLFFNMIWLIVLGKQIEQHLTKSRYIFFLLLVGIFSNTLQYLTSGPNFIGFSGILCGMLTFIWVRQKIAPWEGYQLNRMTYLFMMVFIIGMALMQLFSFIAEKSFNLNFSINIANTAHLSGAFIGYLLGKINFFSWGHPRPKTGRLL